MGKRILSLFLIIMMLLSCVAVFSGCSSGGAKEYPVTIGDVTIEKEPEQIVVLDDALADIVSYIGYDVKMVGRSLECDQDYLKIVPTVGTAAQPNIDAAVSAGAQLVISSKEISKTAAEKLGSEGIPVVTFEKASSLEGLESLYTNIAAALGGSVTGRRKGKEAFDELFDTLESFKRTVPGGVVKTAAYLYMDESGKLCTFIKDSLESELMSYSGALNIFANQETPEINENELKIGTPTYIFYDNENVLEYLENSDTLSSLSALTSGRTSQIPLSRIYRPGKTYEDIIYEMIDMMFIQPEKATADEAAISENEDSDYESDDEQSYSDENDDEQNDEEVYSDDSVDNNDEPDSNENDEYSDD